MTNSTITIFAITLLQSSSLLQAAEPDPVPDTTPMTNAKLGQLLQRIDPDLKGELGYWTMTFENIPAQVITDANANRMRIVIRIAEVESLERDELYRLLQANFESALDARYAVAQGYVWSTFIHPLSSLNEEELVSAVAQTYNAALTYGTSFSSGLFNYGGGDNSEAFDAIIEKGFRT
jgi:hypothetical protein